MSRRNRNWGAEQGVLDPTFPAIHQATVAALDRYRRTAVTLGLLTGVAGFLVLSFTAGTSNFAGIRGLSADIRLYRELQDDLDKRLPPIVAEEFADRLVYYPEKALAALEYMRADPGMAAIVASLDGTPNKTLNEVVLQYRTRVGLIADEAMWLRIKEDCLALLEDQTMAALPFDDFVVWARNELLRNPYSGRYEAVVLREFDLFMLPVLQRTRDKAGTTEEVIGALLHEEELLRQKYTALLAILADTDIVGIDSLTRPNDGQTRIANPSRGGYPDSSLDIAIGALSLDVRAWSLRFATLLSTVFPENGYPRTVRGALSAARVALNKRRADIASNIVKIDLERATLVFPAEFGLAVIPLMLLVLGGGAYFYFGKYDAAKEHLRRLEQVCAGGKLCSIAALDKDVFARAGIYLVACVAIVGVEIYRAALCYYDVIQVPRLQVITELALATAIVCGSAAMRNAWIKRLEFE